MRELVGDSPRVLLADTHRDTLMMYADYLRIAGYVVDQAEDGRLALLKAVLTPPDVIVTETRLDRLDGRRLCQWLRGQPRTQAIPLIVVTADVFPTDIERAYGAGADIVLPKPCFPEELLVAVQTYQRTAGAQSKEGHRRDTKYARTQPGTMATDETRRTVEHLRAEFVDMPGLRLTAGQIARLCGVDHTRAGAVVQALIGAQFLRRHADGTYGRFNHAIERPTRWNTIAVHTTVMSSRPRQV